MVYTDFRRKENCMTDKDLKLKVVLKALENMNKMIQDCGLGEVRSEWIEALAYQAHGTLMGYFLMQAEKEVKGV